ncbi:DNA polymerase III subunit delta [Flavobacterium ardleyense]|uniref:DNA polymerase III subunit delta n=1 Tax=Flavobacterium ardleyense TaxID=2038737 RepID=UPI00298CE996|nr:DNA polymerase III subunit delta [Flavobacterium ardleyense]
MDEITKIIADLKNGIIKPIYFLSGEESYFIDVVSDYIEENVLSEEEKGFNQTILYGRDVKYDEIISDCKRYPMMAEKQVIIVKEAQDIKGDMDILEKYLENPTPTTVLVICYKYKTVDKRKRIAKLIKEKGVLLESKKLYDNQVLTWMRTELQGRGYKIEPKAAAVLGEFLGTDLSKISNELGKLEIILPKGSTITAANIEENIGFSKDFNVFELRNAIGERNEFKAYQIVNNFAQNPKENPLPKTLPQIFSFFIQLMKYHGTKDKNPKNVASLLGIHPYFMKDYDIAIKNYSMRKVSQVLNSIREIDVKSKGVGASMTQADLYKELLIKIFM